MEKEKWQKGIEDLKNIRLSKAEKADILGKILPDRRPLWAVNPWFIFMRAHSVAFMFLFFVCVGGYVAVASERALPGEVLYGIKVNFTEPARDLIKIMPQEKIDWQEEKAKRRIEEVELLVATDKIDEDKKEKIENLFEKHTEEFKRISEKEIKKETEEKKQKNTVEKIDSENRKKEKDLEQKEFEKDVEDVEEKEENSRKSKREDLEKRLEQRLKKLEEAKEKALDKRKNKTEKKDRDSR